MIKNKGFTLIELIVTISIIMLMSTIGLFSLTNARQSARDAKRKADLENIKTAFELFFADCGQYPRPSSNKVLSPIQSSRSSVRSVNCPASPSYVYMTEVPTDPSGSPAFYYYSRPSLTSYVLCAHLEGSSDPTPSGCRSGSSGCGRGRCNYKVAGP